MTMSQRHYILTDILFTVVIAVCAILMPACIHTYPDPDAKDPTEVTLSLSLSFNLKWADLLAYYPPTKAEGGTWRIVIEISKTDNASPPIRIEETFSDDTFSKGELIIDCNETLSPDVYNISVWCDMRESDDSPYHFDLSSLKTISPLFTQSESGIAKRCGFHTSTLDLTPYHNKISADLTIPIELSPPTADFKIVATDVEQFLKYADLPISRGEKYYVRLSFENLIASFFNVSTGQPYGYYDSPSTQLPLPPLFAKQAQISSGWIFTESEREYVSVSLTVINSALTIVSMTRNITFPLERGKTTTVKGDFLTNFYANSINIDNIWEDEIIIPIPPRSSPIVQPPAEPPFLKGELKRASPLKREELKNSNDMCPLEFSARAHGRGVPYQ